MGCRLAQARPSPSLFEPTFIRNATRVAAPPEVAVSPAGDTPVGEGALGNQSLRLRNGEPCAGGLPLRDFGRSSVTGRRRRARKPPVQRFSVGLELALRLTQRGERLRSPLLRWPCARWAPVSLRGDAPSRAAAQSASRTRLQHACRGDGHDRRPRPPAYPALGALR